MTQEFFGPLPPSDLNRDRDVRWLKTQRPDPLAPFGVLGYAEVTSNQSLGSTTADLTGLSVTVTVGSSRKIKITAHGITRSSNGERSIVHIQEGTTVLGRASDFTAASANQNQGYEGSIVIDPSGGSHTYKLRYQVVSGTTHQHSATSTAPAFILVEDIGPA